MKYNYSAGALSKGTVKDPEGNVSLTPPMQAALLRVASREDSFLVSALHFWFNSRNTSEDQLDKSLVARGLIEAIADRDDSIDWARGHRRAVTAKGRRVAAALWLTVEPRSAEVREANERTKQMHRAKRADRNEAAAELQEAFAAAGLDLRVSQKSSRAEISINTEQMRVLTAILRA